MEENNNKKEQKSKSCRGPSGDHRGVRMALQKFDTSNMTSFFYQFSEGVIKWYGYGSIRTDLIKLSRPVLSRFEEIISL